MKDDDIIDITEFLAKKLKSPKLSQSFYLAVAELFYELDINGQEFIDDFIVNFISHVESQTTRKADLKLGTGFTSHQIRKYLKRQPQKEGGSSNSFYCDLIMKIKSACDKSLNGTIPIKGRNSYSKIFYSFDNTIKMVSSQAMLDSLIKKGIFKKNADKTICFVQSLPTGHDNSKDHMIMLFNNVVRRLTKTLISNYHAPNEEQRLTQLSYLSKHIPLSRFKSTNTELKELSRKYLEACQEVIDRNEVKTDFEKRQVEKLSLELGVSTFIFNTKNEK